MFNLNLPKPSLKIIPLGGVGNVTKNMYVYEYGGDIIVIDAGIGFPDEAMPGIDLVIPDVSYLLEKREHIKAFFITHGHDDHIGAIPYIIKDFLQVPIYASRVASAFISAKLKDFGINKNIEVLPKEGSLSFGHFTLEWVHITHSIPDSLNYIITTPVGRIYHGSDFKFDWTPVDENPPEVGKIALHGQKGILCLLSDCLGSERPGATLSEIIITETLEREIANCQGRFIVTTQASNISRLKLAIQVGLKNNRFISIVGRSMEKSLEIGQKLGLIDLPQEKMIKVEEVNKHDDQKVLLLISGSQGQESSALTRIANDEHSHIKIKTGDVVVFSSDPIPGNENAVYNLINNLAALGARVSYSDVRDELHVSGHGSQNDLMLLMALIKPKFLYPIGGTFRHMQQYSLLAQKMGFSPENILLGDNGQILEIFPQKAQLNGRIELKNIMIDGLGIGDVGNIVLRDRKLMSADGIVVVIIPISEDTHQLVGEPDVISRGFVYMKESEALIEEAKTVIKNALPANKGKISEWRFIKKKVEESLGKFFFKKTKRHPLIIGNIIEV